MGTLRRGNGKSPVFYAVVSGAKWTVYDGLVTKEMVNGGSYNGVLVFQVPTCYMIYDVHKGTIPFSNELLNGCSLFEKYHLLLVLGR